MCAAAFSDDHCSSTFLSYRQNAQDSNLAHRQEGCGYCYYSPLLRNQQATVEVGIGYRNDSVCWSTSFVNGLEEIISEVYWDELSILVARASVKYEAPCRLYLRGSLGYGAIFSGINSNTTAVNIGGTTTPLAAYVADGGNGSVVDFSTAMGYVFKLGSEHACHIIPLIGYGYNGQYLHGSNCKEVLNSEDYDCACVEARPLSGLDSSFYANWNSPWVGVDLSYQCCRTIFLATAELHCVWLNSTAHWNLRQDFVKDPTQNGFGYGQLYSIAAKRFINPCWLLGLEFNYLQFATCEGHASLFFVDETAKLDLNGARWTSFNILFSLNYTI